MKYLDIENWTRKEHFYYFKQMDYPHFNICANVDITNLHNYIKKHDYSFFRTMLYITTRTANSIDEFKYRIQDDKVVIYENVHPSFTFLTTKDTFSFCAVHYKENIFEFFSDIETALNKIMGNICIKDEPNRDDVLYITSMPWISFTGVTHPIDLSKTDSIPRIAWGKFFEENGTMKLPLSVQVNHALMDGIHVGRYFNDLQELIDHPEIYFK